MGSITRITLKCWFLIVRDVQILRHTSAGQMEHKPNEPLVAHARVGKIEAMANLETLATGSRQNKLKLRQNGDTKKTINILKVATISHLHLVLGLKTGPDAEKNSDKEGET